MPDTVPGVLESEEAKGEAGKALAEVSKPIATPVRSEAECPPCWSAAASAPVVSSAPAEVRAMGSSPAQVQKLGKEAVKLLSESSLV